MASSQVFVLNYQDTKLCASKTEHSVDLSCIPEEYHKFAGIFSKAKADMLALHRSYDLKINLEEGSNPPFGPIYSMSPSKLQSLREFLDEQLNIGFIRPSCSAYGAPILFIWRKDGSLWLCMDFRALNKITKKDCYPLPLLTDPLDALQKARVYTHLDLQHTYHLVQIAEGDEHKTAFRTHYGSYEWLVMPLV